MSDGKVIEEIAKDVKVASETYDFSDAIQKKIVAMVVADNKAYITNREVVKPEYFPNPALSAIIQIINEYFKKYSKMPTQDELLQEVDSLLKADKRLPYEEYLNITEEVLKLAVEGDYGYVKDKAVAFAKDQAMQEALRNAVRLRKSQKYGEILDAVRGATLVGEAGQELGVDYLENLEKRLSDRRAGNVRAERAIPTFSDLLNYRLGGGILRGELGVIMSPMKRGKTITAGNIAKGAMFFGHDVLHIGGEGSEERTQVMYDAMISGENKDDINAKDPTTRAKAEEVVRESVNNFFSSPSTGKLRIKHYPAGGFTAWTIEAYLQKLRLVEAFEPALIIVDYLGLMKVADKSQKYDDRYERLSEITKELLSLAQRYMIPIWLLHQSTRGSYKSKLVDMDDSADSLEPMRHADIILTLNQTKEDKDKKPEEMFLFLAGGKEVIDRVKVRIVADKACCQVREKGMDKE